MIRDSIQTLMLLIFGFVLVVFCFIAGMSNFSATTSQQTLTDVVGAVVMKDRDDSARVQRETFFLQKDAFEKDVIEEFMKTNNVRSTTSAVFRFVYDDGTYASSQPLNQRSVDTLLDRERETILYTSKAGSNIHKASNYTASEVTFERFESKVVSGKETQVAKVVKKAPRDLTNYNRSFKQVSVRVALNNEKEYQATYMLDTRGPVEE